MHVLWVCTLLALNWIKFIEYIGLNALYVFCRDARTSKVRNWCDIEFLRNERYVTPGGGRMTGSSVYRVRHNNGHKKHIRVVGMDLMQKWAKRAEACKQRKREWALAALDLVEFSMMPMSAAVEKRAEIKMEIKSE